MMDVVEWVLGWVLVIWLVICVLTVPFVWVWMVSDERRYRRERATKLAQDQAINIVDEQHARDAHPTSSTPTRLAPDDDPRFAAYVNWWNEKGNGNV